MRLRPALLIPAVLTAALTAGVTPASAAPLVVLDQGHVDVVDVEYADGELELHVHDETVDPAVERDPADVLFGVRSGARTTVPADPAYAFLGDAGDDVWVLPETQDPELLWPGLSTEEVTAGDAVDLRLLAVRGPGAVSVFTHDPFGAPEVLLDSGNGLPDQLTLPVGTHTHANWAFTAAGTYRLVVRATVTIDGATVSSDPVTLTFCVH